MRKIRSSRRISSVMASRRASRYWIFRIVVCGPSIGWGPIGRAALAYSAVVAGGGGGGRQATSRRQHAPPLPPVPPMRASSKPASPLRPAGSRPAVVVAEHRRQLAHLERRVGLGVDVRVQLVGAGLGRFVGVADRFL